jgi:hypothetical protein
VEKPSHDLFGAVSVCTAHEDPVEEGALIADGAFKRRVDILLVAGAFFLEGADYGWDDLSGFFDEHTVSDLEVFAADFLDVVEGRAGDGGASDQDGFEFGHRRDVAGAADLPGDSFERGLGLFGFIFEGEGPARSFGRAAKFFAAFESVDFDDGAVGLVREFVT